MNLLCFDISSGGISAALFNAELVATQFAETRWLLETDGHGAATLAIPAIEAHLKQVIQQLRITQASTLDSICFDSFMHNFALVDETAKPLTPVFTWLDQRGRNGVEIIRSRMGDWFHEITGCRYHPMFPVFKLASMPLEGARQVVSAKAFLLHRLSGRWIEDHGIASASGLFNINIGDWDSELLAILNLNRDQLPPIASREDVIGRITPGASGEFGLPEGTRVLTGTGDGFFANVGSECETPAEISVTLGTSAVARQTVARPVLDSSSGTFCYQAAKSTYLLGCAGSNGGNVLDWGRRILGTLKDAEASDDPPIFIPVLHGERSPDWNADLRGSWHGLTARHTAADLSRSILEGVIFNLAHFVEIVQNTSKEKASDLILSGNGFLHPMAAPILAAVTGMSTSIPAKPGLASLRGAGICSLRALGRPLPPLDAVPVSPLPDSKILDRYGEYRRIRVCM